MSDRRSVLLSAVPAMPPGMAKRPTTSYQGVPTAFGTCVTSPTSSWWADIVDRMLAVEGFQLAKACAKARSVVRTTSSISTSG